MQSASVRLGDAHAPSPAASPTVIVSGPSRSGTSLVAAALNAAGLWIGDHLDGACFEDIDIASAIERRHALHRRVALAVRHPRMWRMAAKGSDVAHFDAAIERRNAAHTAWGFKRPNILSRLGPEGLSRFRNPRLVICFRDPVGLAQRIATADGVSMQKALQSAWDQLDQNFRMVERLRCPAMLVSFEKLRQDRDAFLDELFRFCGLDVSRERYPAIHAEVDRAGGEYRRLAAAPIVGYIDRPFGWGLSGWCCPPSSKGPTAVDVLANGVKLITTLADTYRPDLLLAGFRSARHGFQIDLRQFGLTGSEIIDVMISGSNISLQDSGYRLPA